MKLVLILIALQQAFASLNPAPLAFSARIQDAALAEEAIDLLHCVADRQGISWELAADTTSSPSVRLDEKDGHLEGTYRGEATKSFRLAKNGWRAACDELVPSAKEEVAAGKSLLSLPTENPVDENAKPNRTKTWLIAGAAVAALAGGFMLWRSGRPDHRSLRME